jgi:hypothetical protein
MRKTMNIPHQRLAAYLDAFSRHFLGNGRPRSVDIEVMTWELGDQHPVEGARLLGITYDSHKDSLEVALESGMDHRMVHPREVWAIEETDGFVSTITAVCQDGSRQIVRVERVGIRRLR